MSWNNVSAGDWDDGGTAAADPAPDIISNHDGEMTCRRCNESGHVARECPDAPEGTATNGNCFKCGQEGHTKADCTEPRVFKGECRICKLEGHPAAECPDKPADKCFNCKGEGHLAQDCTEKRVFDLSKVEDLDEEAAWNRLKEADKDCDLDEFRDALKIYAKALPDLTFDVLEAALRTQEFNVYLIAKEKELSRGFTYINLQGELDKTYELGFHLSPNPKRASAKQGWPPSIEDNLERLKDAGLPMERGIPKCNRCDELGHLAKACPQESSESVDRVVVKCVNCDEIGHRARDCPTPRIDKFACRNCKQSGHQSSECPEPRSAADVTCRKCEQLGHFSKDCPNARDTCRNCGEEGHIAKECDKPRDPATMKCRNCDEMGHASRECPQPKDYSRVKCRNCLEMGHGAARCKNPKKEEGTGDEGTGDFMASGAPENDNNANAFETHVPMNGTISGDGGATTSTPAANGDDAVGW